MSTPLGLVKTTPRGRAWDALHGMPAKRSVSVRGLGGFTQGYERSEPTATAAVDAVVAHARIMVRYGAWPAGQYRFETVHGDKDRREVKLTGPKRGGLP